MTVKAKYIGESCKITTKEGVAKVSFGDVIEIDESLIAGNEKFIIIPASKKKSVEGE